MTATLVLKITPLTTGQLQFEQVELDPTTRDEENGSYEICVRCGKK
jgi:hypothetical protein